LKGINSFSSRETGVPQIPAIETSVSRVGLERHLGLNGVKVGCLASIRIIVDSLEVFISIVDIIVVVLPCFTIHELDDTNIFLIILAIRGCRSSSFDRKFG
jgi:hypothetical protein